jgi:hypothetical protein
VEAEVRLVVRVEVAAGDRALHALEPHPQVRDVERAGVLRGEPAREVVEDRAKLVDLVGLVDADLAHEHAAVLLESHETRRLERPERLADRAARDAEALGDRGLVQLLAGAKLAGQDHALELALDQRRAASWSAPARCFRRPPGATTHR